MKPDTFEKGRVVKSIQGRDKGRYFIILDTVDQNYVLMADGLTRKLEHPKKKKVLHLESQPVCLDPETLRAEGGKLQDSDLRNQLEEHGFSTKRSLCKEG